MPDVLPSYPSLLEPSLDPGSLKKSILRLNEVVEMITGQRGKAEYSLQEGMTSIRKTLTLQNKTMEASIREINETFVAENMALAQRTTLIEAEITDARSGETDLLARITTVDTARVDGDTALATSVDTLQTQVDGNTAQLTVVESSVDGISVKYGVAGYINGSTGGFVFTGLLRNDGAVSYNMEFYSNVIIHGDLIVEGTIDTVRIGTNAITSMAATSGAISFSSISVSKSFYGGTDAFVTVEINPSSSISSTAFGAYSASLRTYPFYVDGVPINSLTAYDTPVGANSAVVRNAANTGTETVVGALIWGPAAVARSFVIPGLTAGGHSFAVGETAGNYVIASIAVTEFKR